MNCASTFIRQFVSAMDSGGDHEFSSQDQQGMEEQTNCGGGRCSSEKSFKNPAGPDATAAVAGLIPFGFIAK